MSEHVCPEPPPLLTVTRTTDTVVLSGELDMETSQLLRDAMLRAEDADGRGVTLDMQDVSFIDSSGLRVLVAFYRHNRRMTILKPSVPVRRVLELSGTIDLFDIVDGASD